MEIKGQSTELGGGRVIEEKKTILKQSNNLRLWKSGPFTEMVKLQRWSELGVWLYSNYPIY